jgi:hypothetical protein
VADKQESNGTPTVPVVAGSHANVKGLLGQLSGAPLVPLPLMLIPTVEPELVIVAVPVTMQLPVGMAEPKLAVAATLSVAAEAVKVMLPGIVLGGALPHVSVKLSSIV